MERKTFTDENGKKGKIGTIVNKRWSQEPKTVKRIISKGAGGTRIYFEEGDYYPANACKIINK